MTNLGLESRFPDNKFSVLSRALSPWSMLVGGPLTFIHRDDLHNNK